MTAGRASEDAKFVLQGDDVYVADVEKVRRTKIRSQVLLFNLEANDIRVIVSGRDVVNGCSKAFSARMRIGHRTEQVRRERCYSAFPR